jgi:opine dehydrogenase
MLLPPASPLRAIANRQLAAGYLDGVLRRTEKLLRRGRRNVARADQKNGFAEADEFAAPAGKCSVAVLGAGHGGLALAGYLAQQGHRVALWNRSPARVAPVAALGGVRLSLPGSAPVRTPIAAATSSMADAVAGTRLVLVCVPASAHADVARSCAPHLRDGQTVLLLPGRTGGALEFRRELREAGCRARILLGEANTFPVAARTVGPAEAVIFGAKNELLAAALPAARTPELLAACRPVFPMLAGARSILQTGLANLGAILHPTITLLNARRIQAGESFDFYTEGVTPAVAATLAAADAERLSIARAYGVPACSLQAWIASAYGHRAATIQEAVGGNPSYAGLKAPNTLEHRYLLEDVPTGLIPLLELGSVAGLALPTLRGLVDLGRVLLGGERWEGPRTLDVLGLDGLAPEEIRGFVERGSVFAPREAAPVAATLARRWGSLVPQMCSGV